MKIALLITACKRPYYLKPTLTSWALADDANDLDGVVIALGRSPKEMEQRELIKELVPGARTWLDSDRAAASNGMHRAIAESASRIFRALKPDFLIFGEEDVVVSSDIVSYMTWAAEKFKDDPRVLLVNAHNRGGQGWDPHQPAEDAEANQNAVRLEPYMNAWVWGTWADRWEKVLEPNWDYECNSGEATTSGYDWQIATRIIPSGNFLAVVPDASRSQNVGRKEGWASSEWSFSFSQAQSFREKRDTTNYQLVETE